MTPTRSAVIRTGLFGLLLVAALTGCASTDEDHSSETEAPLARPVAQTGAPTCPDAHPTVAPATTNRSGDLVPAGATTALLCVYPAASNHRLGATRTSPPAADVSKIVADLNKLATPPSSDGQACLLMDRDQYAIVLGYADNKNAVVTVDLNCGTVSYHNARRRLENDNFLDHWPSG